MNLDSGIPVRPDDNPSPVLVLAPVWVMEDEYSYTVHIDLLRTNKRDHGISVVIWNGVNAHFPPFVEFGLGMAGANEVGATVFTLTPENPERGQLTLDEFRAWVAEALGTNRERNG
jgi:hypothetical protein